MSIGAPHLAYIAKILIEELNEKMYSLHKQQLIVSGIYAKYEIETSVPPIYKLVALIL